jgi:hypothetical protein
MSPEPRVAAATEENPCEKYLSGKATSTLLARLAESVDGARIGRDGYFVAPFKYDPKDQGHRVSGVFTKHECAVAYCEDQKLDPNQYGIFGPFETRKPRDPLLSNDGKPLRVTKVTLEIENGKSICLDGSKFDAVFWGDSAVGKFLVPYYTALGGVEEASELQVKYDREMLLVVHLPGSEWVDAGSVNCLVRGTENGVGIFSVTRDNALIDPGWEGSPL